MPVPYRLRIGLGTQPNPTLIQALVVDNKCYSAPSNVLAIASNATPAQQTAAMAIFNPVASGFNLLLYETIISSDTAGVKVRLQHVVVDPALGTAVTPVNRFRQAVLATSAVAVSTSIAGGQAIPASNLTDTFISGIVPIFLDDYVASTWLTPGTGILVSFNEETAATAVNVGCTFSWAEFSNS